MVYHHDMKTYTIHQVAGLAGVSVRTLHHYDRIGLLRPARRSPSGYRLYSEPDLLRLQQILFYRELDLPLDDIRGVLDAPGFDPLSALEQHRRRLLEQAQRLEGLIHTIDKTIQKLTEDNLILTDEELYEGFARDEAEEIRQEARERYGVERVRSSEERLRKMSKAEWQAFKAEGEQTNRRLASLMQLEPADERVQAVVERHHAQIEHFYPAPAQVYAGLAQLYTDDERFRAYYEKYAPGLADFLRRAMEVYCAAMKN
jgi:DNA-binding transcriptional MerR regulator